MLNRILQHLIYKKNEKLVMFKIQLEFKEDLPWMQKESAFDRFRHENNKK